MHDSAQRYLSILPHATGCENPVRGFQGVPHSTLWPERSGSSLHDSAKKIFIKTTSCLQGRNPGAGVPRGAALHPLAPAELKFKKQIPVFSSKNRDDRIIHNLSKTQDDKKSKSPQHIGA